MPSTFPISYRLYPPRSANTETGSPVAHVTNRRRGGGGGKPPIGEAPSEHLTKLTVADLVLIGGRKPLVIGMC